MHQWSNIHLDPIRYCLSDVEHGINIADSNVHRAQNLRSDQLIFYCMHSTNISSRWQ